jgi:uncharacterized coiled-coil DUF342 family protein
MSDLEKIRPLIEILHEQIEHVFSMTCSVNEITKGLEAHIRNLDQRIQTLEKSNEPNSKTV